MQKLPCEIAIWETIPIIRKEIACCMVREFGLTQKEAAELIGLTPAAVSQYKCNKRANKEIQNISIINDSAAKRFFCSAGCSTFAAQVAACLQCR